VIADEQQLKLSEVAVLFTGENLKCPLIRAVLKSYFGFYGFASFIAKVIYQDAESI
jgi:hypothetical protein